MMDVYINICIYIYLYSKIKRKCVCVCVCNKKNIYSCSRRRKSAEPDYGAPTPTPPPKRWLRPRRPVKSWPRARSFRPSPSRCACHISHTPPRPPTSRLSSHYFDFLITLVAGVPFWPRTRLHLDWIHPPIIHQTSFLFVLLPFL